MMAIPVPQRTKTDLDGLLSSLIGCRIVDDQNFPVLRKLSKDEWKVSFDGADHISIAMGDIAYEEIHHELAGKRSYNAKFIDSGLLQLSYRFKNDHLIKHRLAYYPSPHLRSFRDDPDLYMRDELFLDIVSRRMVPFPIRFDYDTDAAQEIDHPHCHLTLGDVQGCRIPVSRPLSPRWFIEFVLRNFYKTDQYDMVALLPGHHLNFELTMTPKEARLIHMVVPAAADL